MIDSYQRLGAGGTGEIPFKGIYLQLVAKSWISNTGCRDYR